MIILTRETAPRWSHEQDRTRRASALLPPLPERIPARALPGTGRTAPPRRAPARTRIARAGPPPTAVATSARDGPAAGGRAHRLRRGTVGWGAASGAGEAGCGGSRAEGACGAVVGSRGGALVDVEAGGRMGAEGAAVDDDAGAAVVSERVRAAVAGQALGTVGTAVDRARPRRTAPLRRQGLAGRSGTAPRPVRPPVGGGPDHGTAGRGTFVGPRRERAGDASGGTRGGIAARALGTAGQRRRSRWPR